MNKKLALILAGVLMTVSLTACTKPGSSSSDAGSSSAAAASSEDDPTTTMEIFKGVESLETMTLNDINPDDYVELGEYKMITVELAPASVSDEDVEEYIKNLSVSSPLMVEITDRAIEKGDVVNIDFEGKYADSGEAFDGGTAQGYDLEIGSNSFIPGFEDGLIGVALGESKDLNLKFPDDYGAANLAGKDVIFTVKVNKISQKSTDITDEWAKSLGMSDITDLDSLKKKVNEDLLNSAKENYDDTLREEVLNTVVDNSTVKELPEKLINRFLKEEKDVIKSYINQYLMYSGQQVTDKDMVNMMMQNDGATGEAEDYIKNVVKDNASKFVLLSAIAKKEGISITDEDIENRIKKIYGDDAGTAGSSYESFREKVDTEMVREGLIAETVMTFLTDNANVVEPVE